MEFYHFERYCASHPACSKHQTCSWMRKTLALPHVRQAGRYRSTDQRPRPSEHLSSVRHVGNRHQCFFCFIFVCHTRNNTSFDTHCSILFVPLVAYILPSVFAVASTHLRSPFRFLSSCNQPPISQQALLVRMSEPKSPTLPLIPLPYSTVLLPGVIRKFDLFNSSPGHLN